MSEEEDPSFLDGATRVDASGACWTKCCGTWWSAEAWKTPSLPGRHVILPADGDHLNCPTCHLSLRRREPNAVDAEKVLRLDVLTVDEDALRERLRETQKGEWLRFGPGTLAPGQAFKFPVHVIDSVLVSHLALPSDVARHIRVLKVTAGRDTLVEGPIPGEIFAVRIPDDVRRPVDRGGVLYRPTMVSPSSGCSVTLENWTNAPVTVLGALFGAESARDATMGTETIVPIGLDRSS